MRFVLSLPVRRALLWFACGALLVGGLGLPRPVPAAELYRWVDEQGRVSLSDTPPRDPRALKVYRPETPAAASDVRDPPAGDARETPPATTPRGIVVQAELNRRHTAPLRLDTGAEVTVLTMAVAKALAISSPEHMPKHAFKTASGEVTMPITSLRWLRVGSAEARDVTVAIDLDGRLPMGLLGQSFLRRFKVTVDEASGQVSFDR
jgi:clan AA aspartic protease (TIGR02281 family)